MPKQSPIKQQAIIFGSTGLIGTELLRLLGEKPRYEEVIAVNRRIHPDQSLIAEESGIREISFDYERWDRHAIPFKPGADVYIAIGTTRKKTPDPDKYRQIDVEIPIRIAEISALAGAASLQVVSAVGADAGSKFTYNRLKGEMEDGVREAFASAGPALVFRPSLLLGNRNEQRFGEKMAERLYPLMQPFLRGRLTIYKAIASADVARAMLFAAIRGVPQNTVHYDTMVSWSRALDKL